MFASKHLKYETSESNETPRLKPLKALLRETSVYKYFVELKEDALTKKGFFDLTKVSGLRIVGARQFLKNLRIKNCLRQKDIAKMLDVTLSQVKHWENDRDIPLEKLFKIAEILDVSKEMIYTLIDQRTFSIKNVNLPIRPENILHIISHLSPNKGVNPRIYLFKRSKEDLAKIQSILNINPDSSGTICARELYKYLITFFRYFKVHKIRPPLTNEVKHWHEQGYDLKRAIICPCLQTDGSVLRANSICMVRFYGKNKILHDYFVDAMYYEFSELPSSYFIKTESDCFTSYGRTPVKRIIDELIAFAGNTKTSPAVREPVEEYLKVQQPHLKYLINAPEAEQKIALRIWMSTEGWIGLKKEKKRILLNMTIGCAHPAIALQLQTLAKKLNINLNIMRSKSTWSGIMGLSTAITRSCIEFLKLGGFIQSVKTAAYSKYYGGIAKDIRLLGTLELKKRYDLNPKLRNMSTADLHKRVNKIIKRREYKSADYYINYFS